MISDEKLAELQDKAKTRLSPDLEAIIAELRASRKVVEAARGFVDSMDSANHKGNPPILTPATIWHLRAALDAFAELSSINVRSEDEK